MKAKTKQLEQRPAKTARLGNALYLIGCIVAAICIATGAITAIVMHNSGGDVAFAPIVGGVIAALGLISWLIGRVCRYILSGH
ncbi:hypothetical protein [Bradyrhizobium elkanii]|uniref:hypothetical protein n=1 Tax=Bradyrhizobium elkanii TaxID=29448 RepID=UPI00084210DA|nr:hypothetical protein [Bradyrhizobium elkanii]ODM80953.1 hypothetical protein A6X20_21415 [Bradyrhizobium elkanii]ODM85232.1 hypothetical protein A6452_11340 [Bradyrhizobium elkanii]